MVIVMYNGYWSINEDKEISSSFLCCFLPLLFERYQLTNIITSPQFLREKLLEVLSISDAQVKFLRKVVVRHFAKTFSVTRL